MIMHVRMDIILGRMEMMELTIIVDIVHVLGLSSILINIENGVIGAVGMI